MIYHLVHVHSLAIAISASEHLYHAVYRKHNCCIVDRDNNKSMQLDSIMFNSISKQYKK